MYAVCSVLSKVSRRDPARRVTRSSAPANGVAGSRVVPTTRIGAVPVDAHVAHLLGRRRAGEPGVAAEDACCRRSAPEQRVLRDLAVVLGAVLVEGGHRVVAVVAEDHADDLVDVVVAAVVAAAVVEVGEREQELPSPARASLSASASSGQPYWRS